MEIKHDGREDEWGSQNVLVSLTADEFDRVAETLDATPDEIGTYHVDHVTDPGGSYATWREAAADAIERSDYAVLVEHVAMTRVDTADDGAGGDAE